MNEQYTTVFRGLTWINRDDWKKEMRAWRDGENKERGKITVKGSEGLKRSLKDSGEKAKRRSEKKGE